MSDIVILYYDFMFSSISCLQFSLLTYLCRSDSFVSELKTWLASGNGLVVSSDSSSIKQGTHNFLNKFLIELGMSYFETTWSTDKAIDVKANRAKKAHLGKNLSCHFCSKQKKNILIIFEFTLQIK